MYKKLISLVILGAILSVFPARGAFAGTIVNGEISYMTYAGAYDTPSVVYNLAVVGQDGSNNRIVTSNTTSSDSAALQVWSPDGTRLAYTQLSSGGANIYVVNVTDGSSPVQLTAGLDEVSVWSPDGDYIYYLSADTGNPDYSAIKRTKADGSGNEQVITEESDPNKGLFLYDVSPDSSKVVYGVQDFSTGGGALDLKNSDGSGSELMLSSYTSSEGVPFAPHV